MSAFEPPKYIEKLIASINDGAKSAQLGALAFVAIGLVLLATAFAATDEDLLLNRSITVSQLGGAQVPVVLTFGIAPAVFLALHLYTLMRYDMLAANIRRFRGDLGVMVRGEADRERCRQLLANVEFVHARLAPKGTQGASFVFRWAVWFVLALFPVFVLLLVQLSSLRLQNEVVNWIHHGAILLDLALLGWFAWRLPGRAGWPWLNGTRPRIRVVPLLAAVAALALAGADLAWMRVPAAEETTVGEPDLFPEKVMPHALTQPVDLVLCARTGFGCRYLTVTDRAIVPKVWDARGLVEMRAGDPVDDRRKAAIDVAVLTGRTLRFANLGGSQFFAANLAGADLRGADLSRSNLKGANLAGAQLQGAYLRDAQLQGAKLWGASLQRANLGDASLQGAALWGASLQGANLERASLQGAYLGAAQLQGANLGGASLQGANLGGASLQGADLGRASLQGADLGGASLQGADMSGVHLWNVRTDVTTEMSLTDLRNVDFEALSTEETAELAATIPDRARARFLEALTPRSAPDALPAARTDPAPALVSDPAAAAWRLLAPGQVTNDPNHIAPGLAAFLADAVAPVSAATARIVVWRLVPSQGCDLLRDALLVPLRERLLAHVASGKVTLPEERIKDLRTLTPTCSAPEPQPAPIATEPASILAPVWHWLQGWLPLSPAP